MAAETGFLPTPFQFEVAGANLATAVVATFALHRPQWRLPVTLGSLIFLGNAVVGHIYQALARHDHNYGNTYGVCAADLLLPGVLLALLLTQRREPTARAA